TDEVGVVERRVRAELVKRFQSEVRRVLQERDLPARLAAMSMLAELGASFFAPEQQTPALEKSTQDIRRARAQAPGSEPPVSDLAKIVVQGKTHEDRRAAARALGQLLPNPQTAVPALRALLESPDLADRQAAAEGLAGIMRVLFQLSSRGSAAAGDVV